MGLTNGTGPFGPRAKGRFDFEPPRRITYVEPLERRVRAVVGDDVIVDSERAVLVYESGRLPRYAFPIDDVVADVERRPEPALGGHVHVPWSEAEHWLEEDEEVLVHPRDPYNRIEVLRSSRVVEVRVNGEIVAASSRPSILLETSLPPRYYLPREDVRLDLLEPGDIRTGCAYKGWATYFDVLTGAGRVPAAAWTYSDPLRDGEPVRGLLCFFQERPEVEVVVDGVRAEAPGSVYARTAWLQADWAVPGEPVDATPLASCGSGT